MLDGLFYGVVAAILIAVTGGYEHTSVVTSTGTTEWFSLSPGGYLLAGVLAGVYYWVSWAAFGRTLGQRIAGIYIVREEDGGQLTPSRAALRSLWFAGPSLASAAVVGVGMLVGIISLVGLLVSAANARRQGWHDRLARSLTVTRAPW